MTAHDVHTTARLYLCTDARQGPRRLCGLRRRGLCRRRGHHPAEGQEHRGGRGTRTPGGPAPGGRTGTAGSGPSTTGRTSPRCPGLRCSTSGRRTCRCRSAPEAAATTPRDRAVHPQPRAGGRRHRRLTPAAPAWTTSASGPVWATPTKPGRAAVGLDLVRMRRTLSGRRRRGRSSGRRAVPWFAIGGIDLGNVEQVVEAGASRIVVVRAITEAPTIPPAPPRRPARRPRRGA